MDISIYVYIHIHIYAYMHTHKSSEAVRAHRFGRWVLYWPLASIIQLAPIQLLMQLAAKPPCASKVGRALKMSAPRRMPPSTKTANSWPLHGVVLGSRPAPLHALR